MSLSRRIACAFLYRMSCFFFFSSRRRHTRLQGDWSSDVCSSDLQAGPRLCIARAQGARSCTDPHRLAGSFLEVFPDAELSPSRLREGRRGGGLARHVDGPALSEHEWTRDGLRASLPFVEEFFRVLHPHRGALVA